MEFAQRNYGRMFLFATALLVSLALLGKQPGEMLTLIVLVCGVVLLGLPHGALDPAVAERAFGRRRAFSLPKFYAGYALIALGYALLWWKWPTVGLGSFLAIAACHFGSDWEERGSAVTRICYGLAVVTLPALSHPAEVAPIYLALGSSEAEFIVRLSRMVAIFATLVASASAVWRWHARPSDALEFFGIVTSAIFLPPLIFFTCYFTLLHSPRHLLETAESLGLRDLRAIFKTTAPVVLATVALGLLAFILLPSGSISARLLCIVFVGLASLTVPHMILEIAAATSSLPPAAASADRAPV